MLVFAAHAASAAAMHFISGKNAIKRGSRYGAPNNTRPRRTIQEIYMCLGAKYFQRVFHMSYESLHEKLKEGIVLTHKQYFAGGSPYDIMAKYGMSHMFGMWLKRQTIRVIGTFLILKVMKSNYELQGSSKLRVLLNLNGLEASKVGVDQQKFFCGRKHKFGLNCQVVCDVRGRYLDISIIHGASAADCLVFENSELYKRLQKGVLAEDLVLFGDNAYINSIFMTTPYPNTSGGSNDN
ncbi:hypothetical protein HJC23_006606 [Cyclotella cryptica]|uniref:DDE Tnp4 domain-containing protein n=1 Tax=Cyclotella cryptica TaxID=29204 RepID=A0ABD3QWJ6_9STRA